ncbi:MAG: tRNA pseudouridine(38-40) synthase TruA [Ignavibacteriales bacterium]|nr:tRNA pseudouridine(38-40) synthase TruA [Ignavibacteriales bacterium]
MRNIKLTIEYDGTNYVGWQVQPNGPSVQAEVEKALRQILQEDIHINGAGRTDSGVHARGQVANFLTAHTFENKPLCKSLNGILPSDIAVLSAEDVPESFHARYSAQAREYLYCLALQPTALWRNYSWYVGGYTLDKALMNFCTDSILGEHDFASFCKSEAEVDHYRCVIHSAQWQVIESQMIFRISANRFLHGMVRALVGTMVEVGRGYRPLEDFRKILDAKDRKAAGMAAPAKGLFLERITY